MVLPADIPKPLMAAPELPAPLRPPALPPLPERLLPAGCFVGGHDSRAYALPGHKITTLIYHNGPGRAPLTHGLHLGVQRTDPPDPPPLTRRQ